MQKQKCIARWYSNEDGVEGGKSILHYGGTVVVQKPSTAEVPIMPEAVRKALGLIPKECLSPEKALAYLMKINK